MPVGRVSVLDHPAEEGLDDLAVLAACCCDASTAMVRLVTDQHQWIDTRFGPEPTGIATVDLICARTLDRTDLLVISDLALDPLARSLDRDGARFYAGAPLRLTSGAVLGVLCVFDAAPRPGGLSDVQADALRRLARRTVAQVELHRLVADGDGPGRLAESERVLSISERQWRGLFENLSEGFLVGELVRDDGGRAIDWVYRYVNPAWANLVGLRRRDVIGRRLGEVLPGVEQSWIDDPALVVETGEPRTFVRPLAALGREYEAHAFHLEGDRFAMLLVEITERVRAVQRQAALLTLGDTLHEATEAAAMTRTACALVGKALNVKRAGLARVDLPSGTMTIEADWAAPGMASVIGTHRFAKFGDFLNELGRNEAVVVDDVRVDARSASDPAQLLALGVRSLVNIPMREHGDTVATMFVHDDAPRRWTPEELAFLRSAAERVEVSVARLRGEEQERVLNQELSHRLKNTLAMVQAIATQTLRRVSDRDAVASFEQRLGALAAAHDVLLRRNWSAADLATVAAGVLGVLDGRGRFRLDGPPVELSARAAMSTSLLLHELGTNALKYGALLSEDGQVEVRWSIDEDGMLAMDWVESGGPPASPPVRHGFGSRLIGMGLVGTGGVDVRYGPNGFSATMRAPVAELRQA